MKIKKVMMVTMGLGLGGAETHIVELSRALRREGIEVSVCSRGGEYVPMLEAEGVRHYEIPMHVRSLPLMVRSFRLLLRIVKEERPDVLHAHARIPALVARFVSVFRRVPLVTTAHGSFKVTPLLRLLSCWGRRQLAVSEDLKTYLLRNYRVKEDGVTVTINGIDTARFSPETSARGLRAELSLPPKARCVVYVSRMDYNACGAAFRLAEFAVEVYRAHPDVRFVLVGGGDALDEIRALSEKKNDEAGCELIRVVGGRTDVERFCALADVFVGISRAALEALACAKPVILAGNQGYLGTFTKEKLDDCILTNFTCRELPYPSETALRDELLGLLASPRETLRQLGAYGRQVILEHYSVKRMVQDAIYTYKMAIRPKHYDYLLSGYYGFDNIGDEYTLRAIVHNLHQIDPDCDICVLARRRTETRGLLIYLKNRFSPLAVWRAARRSSVALFGGGTLLQDATSSKSLWYYLWVINTARRCGCRTMLYGNGVGPITRRRNQRAMVRALRRMDVITLRDGDSLTLLQNFGVEGPFIELTADETFTIGLPAPNPKTLGRYGLTEGEYIVVSLRRSYTTGTSFTRRIAAVLDRFSREMGCATVLLPMQFDHDMVVCDEVSGLMQTRSLVVPQQTAAEFHALAANAKLLIGMRLHSLILGMLAGAPVYGVVYDPKVESFMRGAGSPFCCRCDNFNEDDVVRDLKRLAGDTPERREVADFLENNRVAASKNAELAAGLLHGSLYMDEMDRAEAAQEKAARAAARAAAAAAKKQTPAAPFDPAVKELPATTETAEAPAEAEPVSEPAPETESAEASPAQENAEAPAEAEPVSEPAPAPEKSPEDQP